MIVLLWTLVVISPLLFMNDYNQDWRTVHVIWSECAVVGFAFLVNRFLLMPRLFFAKRYVAYALSFGGLLLFTALFVLHFDGVNIIISLFSDGYHTHSMSQLHNTPPMMGGGMPPMMDGGMPPMRGGGMPPTRDLIPPAIKVVALTLITIALDMGLSITRKWIISEQRQTHADKEMLVAQLQNLQSQVSPHFLMNTLNNIHALVDIDSVRAKQTIIELSNLMDYLLYESSTKRAVSLQRELDFIESYTNLMRVRFSKQVKVLLTYDDNPPSVEIPPLLFLNFIENAFKYGVDNDQESIIKISFSFSNDSIVMEALNSNHSDQVRRKHRGFGISNSRKRLDLLYGDRYRLDISERDKIYYVTLKIPIA